MPRSLRPGTVTFVTIFIRVLWLVLAGIWLALAYALAAVLTGLFTAGAPVSQASLRMSAYALWPFGRSLTGRPAEVGGHVTGSVSRAIWLLAAAWWLALVHIVLGLLLCLTVVGLPFGVAILTLLPVTLHPLSARVVSARRPRSAPVVTLPAEGRVLAAA